MKYILTTFICLILSCKSASGTSASGEFPSGEYKVVSVKNDDFKPYKDYVLKLNSEEKRLEGTFDCNKFSVNYEKEGDSVKFGFAMATKMYCEGKMHNENAFVSVLNSITSYTFKKSTLTFLDKDENTIIELELVENE